MMHARMNHPAMVVPDAMKALQALGELTKKGLPEKLIELIRAVQTGQYGSEVMARCRNQQPEKLSEADLRSFLEDIESTIKK